MELTQEILDRYIGGQMETQNKQEKYLYRGEIESATIEGEGEKETLKVRFAWYAKMEGVEWVNDEDLDYALGMSITSVAELDEGKIMLTCPIIGEWSVLFPPDGSKLDPAQVKGLDLSKKK